MTRALHVTEAERRRVVEVEDLRRAGAPEPLVERLADPSWTVRRAVVSALVRLGQPAVEPLTRVLREQRDDEARLAAAVEALVASFADLDGAVIALTECEDAAVVCDALQILGRRRCSAAMGRLAAILQSPNDNVALAAIEAVGRIGGSAAVDLLIGAIESKNFFRVFPAIDVLGRTGDPRAVAPLCALLGEPHYAIDAARALGHAGQPPAAPALASLLVKPNDALTRVAATALMEIHDRYTERFGPSNAVADALARVRGSVASRRLTRSLIGADAGERSALCRVLGWIGGTDSVEALVELLDAEPAAAHDAAVAIARLGAAAEPLLVAALAQSPSERRLLLLPLLARSRTAMPSVLECLEDADAGVRAVACDTLGKIGNDAAVPRLFALLDDGDARVAQAAASAIQALGGVETERLALQAAGSQNARIRRSGLRILAYFGWPSALEVLLAALEDPDERMQDVASAGLAVVDDERALGALLVASGRPSPRTRSAAVRALGQARNVPSVRERLRAALRDPDAWVRYYACQALSRLGDHEAAELVAGLLTDSAGHVRVAALEALARLRGDAALEALHAAADSDDADVRRAALLAIGSVKSVSSLAVLRKGLASPDAATRLIALSALSEFEDHEALESARDALADADASVRGAAIALLATRPGVEATLALVAQLDDPNLRERVLAALSTPTEGRIEGVVKALHSASSETAAHLVSALARMRRPEASAALENAFARESAEIRRAVAPALAALGTGSARALLERGATEDVDAQVRLVCAAVLSS